MAEKIDDASYAEGRAAFASGASLRSIIESMLATDDAPTTAARRDQEAKAMGRALGFADALLDFIRHPIIVGTTSSITPKT